MKTTEKYYAIRVGNPKRHTPYFLLREQSDTPAIFVKRKDAVKLASDWTDFTVVEVELREL